MLRLLAPLKVKSAVPPLMVPVLVSDPELIVSAGPLAVILPELLSEPAVKVNVEPEADCMVPELPIVVALIAVFPLVPVMVPELVRLVAVRLINPVKVPALFRVPAVKAVVTLAVTPVGLMRLVNPPDGRLAAPIEKVPPLAAAPAEVRFNVWPLTRLYPDPVS